MALLSLEDVSIRYGERPLLDRVTLLVGERERIGIVGANGSGKSTLLKILAGVEEPDEGGRTLAKGVRVGYLEQEPQFEADARIRDVAREGLGRRNEVLAAVEAVHAKMAAPDCDATKLERLLKEQARLEAALEALGGYDVEHKVESVLRAVGLRDPDASCGPPSGGERRRLALARLLIAEPEVLLLDEPTNHLDAETIAWLEGVLLESRAALVLITHDRYFLDRIVERVVELDRAKLHASDGGYAEYVVQRSARLERERQAEATRLNLLRRETEWIRRGPPARTTKSKSRIQRYDALVAAAPDAPSGEIDFAIPMSQRLGDKVVHARGVTKSWGERTVLGGLDLELQKGERLGIVGPNGAGKSTFVRICMGLLEPDAGHVEIGSTVAFSFLDQQRAQLDDDNTVIEEVAGPNDHVRYEGRTLRVESYLERFLFDTKMLRTKVGSLSGGERNRVLIAKLLAIGGNVLIFDEPTNDLDLTTLRVLEEALCAFSGSAMIVSHDRWFLDRVATRVLHIGEDGTHRHHAGDLSSLLDKLAKERKARDDAEASARAAEKAKRTAQSGAAPRKKSHSREKRELETLTARIEEIEAEIAKLDEELSDPGLYDGSKDGLDAMVAQRKELEGELERAYARWEELEEILAT